MQIRDEAEGEEFAFNLAPMIDIVFLLLIFFMVATTYIQREEELGIELPQAESGDEPIRELDEIVISVLEGGRMVIEGQEHDQRSLIRLLSQAARHDPDTPVTIRGDRRIYHGDFVTVLDACRTAGLKNLGVMALDG